MKAATILIIVIVALAVIGWIMQDTDFHIAESLPFCSGEKPNFYDIGALALLTLLVWGLARLAKRRRDDDDEDEGEYEELDEEDDNC